MRWVKLLWNECLKIVNKRIFILSHIGFIVMTVLFSWAYTSNLKADDTVAQMVNALLGTIGNACYSTLGDCFVTSYLDG